MSKNYNYKGMSLEQLSSLPKEEFDKLPPKVLLRVIDYSLSRSVDAVHGACANLEKSNERIRQATEYIEAKSSKLEESTERMRQETKQIVEGSKERSLDFILGRYSRKDSGYRN